MLRVAELDGLELWRQAWDGRLRTSSLCELKDGTHILLVGGLSWGDEPFDGYHDMAFAAATAALEVAGFNR